jgi:hypothetical protein
MRPVKDAAAQLLDPEKLTHAGCFWKQVETPSMFNTDLHLHLDGVPHFASAIPPQ